MRGATRREHSCWTEDRKHRARERSIAARLLCLGVLVCGSVATPAAWAGDESKQGDEAPGSLTFVGRNLLGRANGSFAHWRFTRFDVDFDHIEQGVVEVEVDVESIDTGIGRRDDHLRSDDFFDIARYPRATVRVHDARPDGQSEAGHPRYKASFDVQIRDVTKSIEGSFEIVSGAEASIEGDLSLNRVDFGVGKPHSRWNPMSVREEIPIHFSVQIPAQP